MLPRKWRRSRIWGRRWLVGQVTLVCLFCNGKPCCLASICRRVKVCTNRRQRLLMKLGWFWFCGSCCHQHEMPTGGSRPAVRRTMSSSLAASPRVSRPVQGSSRAREGRFGMFSRVPLLVQAAWLVWLVEPPLRAPPLSGLAPLGAADASTAPVAAPGRLVRAKVCLASWWNHLAGSGPSTRHAPQMRAPAQRQQACWSLLRASWQGAHPSSNAAERRLQSHGMSGPQTLRACPRKTASPPLVRPHPPRCTHINAALAVAAIDL